MRGCDASHLSSGRFIKSFLYCAASARPALFCVQSFEKRALLWMSSRVGRGARASLQSGARRRTRRTVPLRARHPIEPPTRVPFQKYDIRFRMDLELIYF